MTDREQIEAARAVFSKATPGPWKAEMCLGGSYVIDNTLPEDAGKVRNIAEVSWHMNNKANADLISAAPALMRRVDELEAWQREAVEWLDREIEHKRLVLRRIDISEKYKQVIIIPEIAKLEALIAQAKTEEVGR